MSAILRVLSKSSDGTIESTIIPIPEIVEFNIKVRDNNNDSAENLVKEEGEKEIDYTENSLTITKRDGTETEFDTIGDSVFTFEIRDGQGEILANTNNLFKLEEAFLSAHLEDVIL